MFKKTKVIFLGDTGVGKSCIISALNNHPINTIHQPTIGMDFSIKILESQNGPYKLQLWDTAGQQKFRSIMPSYIRNSRIAIIVYDVTCLKSFMNLQKWINLYSENCQQGSNMVILGNKIDLYNNRKVNMQRVQKQIVKKKYKYIQISAKTGEGIEQFLQIITQQLDKMQIQFSYGSTSQNIKIRQAENRKNQTKGCCGLNKIDQCVKNFPLRESSQGNNNFRASFPFQNKRQAEKKLQGKDKKCVNFTDQEKKDYEKEQEEDKVQELSKESKTSVSSIQARI